jgi:cytochrome c peroxidase
MHDGSLPTLAEVVAFYDRGGIPNPGLDMFVFPLGLTAAEQQDLVAFLEALTGALPAIDRPALPR